MTGFCHSVQVVPMAGISLTAQATLKTVDVCGRCLFPERALGSHDQGSCNGEFNALDDWGYVAINYMPAFGLPRGAGTELQLYRCRSVASACFHSTLVNDQFLAILAINSETSLRLAADQ